MSGCQLDGFDGFRQSPYLIYFDQNAVGNPLVNSPLQSLGVGDEQIVPRRAVHGHRVGR